MRSRSSRVPACGFPLSSPTLSSVTAAAMTCSFSDVMARPGCVERCPDSFFERRDLGAAHSRFVVLVGRRVAVGDQLLRRTVASGPTVSADCLAIAWTAALALLEGSSAI